MSKKIKKLIFATHNDGKVIEMRKILEDLDIEILTAEEAGVMEDVVEDRETFVGNSYKKAKFIVDKTGEWSVADDTGICIDALDGQPGVYSARWAGEEDIVDFTLNKLKDIPEGKRTAYFETAVVLVSPEGERHEFIGRTHGKITTERKGEMHSTKLPYDVIFMPKGIDKTFAEITREEKNNMSNRGEAFRKLREFLK